jgi:hypothetical protein
MNRRDFFKGLFAAAGVAAVPDILRPTLLTAAKTAAATVATRGISVDVLRAVMEEMRPEIEASFLRSSPMFTQLVARRQAPARS